MPRDWGDNYRTVTVQLCQVRDDSIMVVVPRMTGWRSIPRSVISGVDERRLDWYRKQKLPVELTIRIFDWKADELHLA